MSQMKQLLLRLGVLGVFLFRGEEKHRMEATSRLVIALFALLKFDALHPPSLIGLF
jgi:hypothetical protein